MNPWQLEIMALAVVTAAACALPGVFLVLRRMSLMSDAISHSILFGIVVAFFFTGNLSSPWLVLGAALVGVLTVSLTELLHGTGLVREDAAIGLVFPVLFSLGVVLITRYAGSVHLDVDAVLVGAPELTVLRRLEIGGRDLGPQSLWVMLVILLVNIAFLTLFYKELKLATFDAGLATALGFAPAVLHYGLMTLVSITAVGAFDAVGSILVVALMIGPAATALLLTDRLSRVLLWSVVLALVAAVTGCWLGYTFNTSLAGAMATMTGFVFTLAYLFSPEQGLVAILRRQQRQRHEFALALLAIHLLNHEGRPEAEEESSLSRLPHHLHWTPQQVDRVVRQAERAGHVQSEQGRLRLTPEGRMLARQQIGG